jgi:hypothetical protein
MTPAAATPILDVLHADPTRFVTRSVANHVNDIAKDDPDLALNLLERWRGEGRQQEQELEYLVRHGARSLVKRCNRRALALIGVAAGAAITVTDLVCARTVELGDALEFSFTVTAPNDTLLVIDYAIGFPGPTGRIGRKVYKLTSVRSTGATPLRIRHRHPLRAGMTTRRIIPGRHHLEVQINGQPQPALSFMVTPPAQRSPVGTVDYKGRGRMGDV